MMEKIEKELRQRKNMLDKSFEWSEENIQKILAFNDAVLHKYKEAYDKVCLVKQDIETLSNSGKSIYDNYCITAEILYCPQEGIASADYETLEKLESCHVDTGNIIVIQYDKSEGKYSIPLEPEDECFLQDLSWNIGILKKPEFSDVKIAYLLHNFFHDGNYSLQDLICMNPDYVKVFIKVELE